MKTIFTLLCTLALFFTSACSKKREEQKPFSFSFNIGADIECFDPRKASNVNTFAIVRALYDGLTRVDENGIITPSIAERIDVSKNKKKYTFHLRKSQWTNGEKVKASDFVYAWCSHLNSQSPSQQAPLFYPIKNAKAILEGSLPIDQLGVKALDDVTLEIELDEPVPYFLELLSLPAFFPVYPELDRKNANWGNDPFMMVSNGPFQFSKFKPRSYISLVKNPTYWDREAVVLKELNMLFIKDVVTELYLYEQGEIDWAGSPISILPLDSIEKLSEKGVLRSKPMLGTYFFRLQTEKLNPSLRRALFQVVDDKEICDCVFSGLQEPAHSFTPPILGLEITKPIASIENIDVDSLSILYLSEGKGQRVALAAQQQIEAKLHIPVKLEAVEGKVFFERVRNGDYTIATSDWLGDIPDPLNFLEIFETKTTPSNRTKWENPTFTKAIREARSCSNLEKRKALLEKAETILLDEAPIIPLFYLNMLYVENPHIDGVVLTSYGGIDFKWVHKK